MFSKINVLNVKTNYFTNTFRKFKDVINGSTNRIHIVSVRDAVESRNSRSVQRNLFFCPRFCCGECISTDRTEFWPGKNVKIPSSN